MTEQQKIETKEKILTVARELFALKGFEGASVREIAKRASVNIAAINYHFDTKEKLFNQVMDLAHREASDAIEAHVAAHPEISVEELVEWIFGYFLERADILRSVFKMMLSETGWNHDCGADDEDFGPPGGLAIAKVIVRQLKHDVPESDMFWAVKMLFSTLTHMALLYSNHFCHLPAEQAPYHDRASLEADLRRLSRVILRDLG